MSPEERREEDRKKIEKLKEKRENLKKHPRKLQAYREKGKIQRQKHRQRQKKVSESLVSPFANKNVYGKGMMKLKKALPQSPDQAVCVLNQTLLQQRLNAAFEEPPNTSKKSLSNDTARAIIVFYNSDICSRPDPSMNGTIFLENESGEKVRTAKRYMLFSGGESHQLFLEQHPGHHLSLAKFYELRPKNVRCFVDTPHRTCMCKYHANVLFLLEILSKFMKEARSIKEFVDFIVCDCSNINCVVGSCEECEDFEDRVLNKFKDEDLMKIVKLRKCTDSEGGPIVIEQQQSVREAVEILCQQMKSHFKFHHYIKKTQEKSFEQLKQASTDENIVLQVDFAENYSVTSQNETQSAHFSKPTITVFTGVAHSREKVHKMTLITDDKHHDTYAVFHLLKVIVVELKKIFLNIKRLAIVSDGSAAQFKNRFNLLNLLNFEKDHDLQVSWHFLATSHGKGTVDAIGGVVKNVVNRRVISQNLIISNAKEFCSLAIQHINNEKINVIYVDVDEMTESRLKLQDRLKFVPPIPQLQKLHHFEVASTSKLLCWPSSLREEAFKKTVEFNFEPSQAESAVKRSRGRPRKEVTVQEPAEKKKRGRPQKQA